LDPTVVVFAVLAAAEPPLVVALTMPKAPPPTTMAVIPIAMALVRFRENMSCPFVFFRLPLNRGFLRWSHHAGAR
jgi:hypothetical protein